MARLKKYLNRRKLAKRIRTRNYLGERNADLEARMAARYNMWQITNRTYEPDKTEYERWTGEVARNKKRAENLTREISELKALITYYHRA